MRSDPDRPPRVLMVLSQFHPLRGGAENQAFELARRLGRMGCQVTVLTLRRPGLPVSERLDGIRIHRLIRVVHAGALFGVSYLGSLLLYLLLRGWRYDILHAHQLYLDAVGVSLFARLARKPCIAKVACSGEDGDVARLNRLRCGRLLWPLLRGLDRIVALTRHMRQELLDSGFAARQVTIIPNGVDVERFAPAQTSGAVPGRPESTAPLATAHPGGTAAGTGAAGGVVLFVGRLTAQKDWKTLLQAVSHLREARPEAALVILGDGSEREALETESRRLGLERTVRLLGAGHDPAPCFRSSDVFVLPTRSEGMSNALLEAMAAGLPCVATRIRANAEVLDHGADGLLVPAGDARALADALLLVLADRQMARSLGAAARLKAVALYDFDRVVGTYRSLYRDLLARRRGAP